MPNVVSDYNGLKLWRKALRGRAQIGNIHPDTYTSIPRLYADGTSSHEQNALSCTPYRDFGVADQIAVDTSERNRENKYGWGGAEAGLCSWYHYI